MHLVLPDRQLFSRDKVDASASIVLKVQRHAGAGAGARHPPPGGNRGQRAQTRAGLGGRRDRQAARRRRRRRQYRSSAGADERKVAYENRLRKEVENIVTSVVGPGRARVQITADFDVNRITQTSDKYDPDGRVMRSSQTREEQSTASGAGNGGAVSVGNELPGGAKTLRRQWRQPARPEQKTRGNRQLRDFAHHQDRGDRSRPRQPHFRRRAGRRHLYQERQGQAGLQAALEGGNRPHRRAGALGHRLRRQARRPGRSGQSALCRNAADADQRAGRLDELSAIHQGRHHARRQYGRHGAARPGRAVHGGAPAGAPHHDAGRRRPALAGAAGVAGAIGAGRRRRRPAASMSPAAPAAASPTPAAPTSRSSAATKRSPSPTAPRR